MRAIVLAVAVGGLIGLAGCRKPPPADPQTTFEAFKVLCIDTGAKPGNVAAAVRGLGGVSAPAAAKAPPKPFPIDGKFWTVALKSGRKLWVASTVSSPPPYRPEAPPETDESCTVTVMGKDPDSAAAARAWAGDRAEDGLMFRDLAGDHHALRNFDEADAALREDRLWMLTVEDGGPSLDLDLVHRHPKS